MKNYKILKLKSGEDLIGDIRVGRDGGHQGAASKHDLVGEAGDAGTGSRTHREGPRIGDGTAVDDELIHHVGS